MLPENNQKREAKKVRFRKMILRYPQMLAKKYAIRAIFASAVELELRDRANILSLLQNWWKRVNFQIQHRNNGGEKHATVLETETFSTGLGCKMDDDCSYDAIFIGMECSNGRRNVQTRRFIAHEKRAHRGNQP